MDVEAARQLADRIIADGYMALFCCGQQITPWVPYADGLIVLPARKRGTGYNQLRLSREPGGSFLLTVSAPFVRLRRRDLPHTVNVADTFGPQIGEALQAGAVRRAAYESKEHI